MSFNQITPTFCNAMSKFTAALDCALCEVSATFGCIERTFWIMITCSTKLQNCMLNGSKRDNWILEWTFDQRESSIHQQVKLDYVDTGAHIAPHCGVTNAKLRASIPVSFIINLLFCWICHHFSSCSIIRKLQLTWAFPPSWQWQGKCTKALMGSGLSSRGWRIKYSRWQLLLCLHLFLFQFFSSYFCILFN